MFTAAELAEHRADAESLMTLTLAAFKPNGFSIESGYEVPAFLPQGTTAGKGQGGSQATRDTVTRFLTVGGTSLPVLEGGLHIPISAPLPTPGEERGIGWEYVVVAVGPADDPALLNKRYLVVSVPVKSFASARRLDVVEV